MVSCQFRSTIWEIRRFVVTLLRMSRTARVWYEQLLTEAIAAGELRGVEDRPMKRVGFLLLSFVLFGGCSSGPNKRNIEAQLNNYHLFAEPETWYVCLGTIYDDELYKRAYLPVPEGCRFSLLNYGADPKALQLV